MEVGGNGFDEQNMITEVMTNRASKKTSFLSFKAKDLKI